MQTGESIDINNLVKKAKQGDAEAFSQLYSTFAQRIFSYIRIKVQNRQEAEDVLQEVFVKAYRGLAGLKDLENLNFSAWLYAITGNTVNDYFRKKYRSPITVEISENFDAPHPDSVERDMMNRSDLEVMRRAFGKLPVQYREVLELRFVQELTLKEVCKILRKTNLAVRLLQFRALKKVREVLKDNDFWCTVKDYQLNII